MYIVADDGRIGSFNVSPYLGYEAFTDLKNSSEFIKVFNGRYFVEWECGADLSTDTIEARWQVIGKADLQETVSTNTPVDALSRTTEFKF